MILKKTNANVFVILLQCMIFFRKILYKRYSIIDSMNDESNKIIKPQNMGEKGVTQQNNHGFSSHSAGTWNQDAFVSSAEKGSKADVPPKVTITEKKEA
jgi:hypothetical protein